MTYPLGPIQKLHNVSSTPQPELGDPERTPSCARDDRREYDALFDRWFPRVYAFARRRVATDGEAQAVTEEVGVRVAQRLRHPTSDGLLANYLLKELVTVLKARQRAANEIPDRAFGTG